MPAGYLYVDGTVGDVGHGVLRDRGCWPRRAWSWWWPPSTGPGRAPGLPQIATRGWVHAPEAEELLGEASQAVGTALEKAMADGARDVEVLQRHARKALGKIVASAPGAGP